MWSRARNNDRLAASFRPAIANVHVCQLPRAPLCSPPPSKTILSHPSVRSHSHPETPCARVRFSHLPHGIYHHGCPHARMRSTRPRHCPISRHYCPGYANAQTSNVGADQAIPPAIAASVATTQALAREPNDHDSVQELRSAKEHGPASCSTDHDQVPRDDVFRADLQLAFAALPDVRPNWAHKYACLLVDHHVHTSSTGTLRSWSWVSRVWARRHACATCWRPWRSTRTFPWQTQARLRASIPLPTTPRNCAPRLSCVTSNAGAQR